MPVSGLLFGIQLHNLLILPLQSWKLFLKILTDNSVPYNKNRKVDSTSLNLPIEGKKDPRNNHVYYKLTTEAVKIRYPEELSPLLKYLPKNSDLMVEAMVVNEKYVPDVRKKFLSETIFLDSPGLSDISDRTTSLYSAFNCCIHFFNLCSFIAILIDSGHVKDTSKDTLLAVKLAKTVPMGSQKEFENFKKKLDIGEKKLGIMDFIEQAKNLYRSTSEEECGLLFSSGSVRFYLSKFEENETNGRALFYDVGGLLVKNYRDQAPKADSLGTLSTKNPKLIESFIEEIKAVRNSSLGGTADHQIHRLLSQIEESIKNYNPSWFNIFAERKDVRVSKLQSLIEERNKLYSQMKNEEE